MGAGDGHDGGRGAARGWRCLCLPREQWDGFRQPTTITEIDWYSPALGRTIRSESRSEYVDRSSSRSKGSQWTRGEWIVLELTEFRAMKP